MNEENGKWYGPVHDTYWKRTLCEYSMGVNLLYILKLSFWVSHLVSFAPLMFVQMINVATGKSKYCLVRSIAYFNIFKEGLKSLERLCLNTNVGK